MALGSMSDIFEGMSGNGQEFWEVVLADDMDERQVSREASMAKMLTTWQAMQDAADSYTGRKRSVSGLVGGAGSHGGRLRRSAGGAAAAVQI